MQFARPWSRRIGLGLKLGFAHVLTVHNWRLEFFYTSFCPVFVFVFISVAYLKLISLNDPSRHDLLWPSFYLSVFRSVCYSFCASGSMMEVLSFSWFSILTLRFDLGLIHFFSVLLNQSIIPHYFFSFPFLISLIPDAYLQTHTYSTCIQHTLLLFDGSSAASGLKSDTSVRCSSVSLG